MNFPTADCSFLTVTNTASVATLNVQNTFTATTLQLNQDVMVSSFVTTALQVDSGGAGDSAVLAMAPGAGNTLTITDTNIVCTGTTSIGNAFVPDQGVTAVAVFPTNTLTFTRGVLTSASPAPPSPMLTMTVNTANVSTGSTDNLSFGLPLVASGTYNFTVEWGDGSSSVITAYNQPQVNHKYATTGSYIVTINGTITGWSFAGTGDKLKLIDISDWGDLVLDATGTLNNYFQGCANMNVSALTGSPLRAGTTSMLGCFVGCTTLNSANIATWDVSAVQDMMAMFAFASSFNADLSSWVTSNVRTMRQMFFGATSFNADLSSWDTSSVTDMHSMFFSAESFNNGDVANTGATALPWDTSAVTDAESMFQGCFAFNQTVNFTDTSRITTFFSMFKDAHLFNNGDTLNVGSYPLAWTTTALLDASEMFNNCYAFNQTITFADTGNVQSLRSMFTNASIFNNGDPANAGAKQFTWPSTASLTDASLMFNGCAAFNQTLTFPDTSNLVTVSSMFINATVFNNGDIANSGLKQLVWTTTSLVLAPYMFNNCTAFNQTVTFSDATNITSFESMFEGAALFNNGDTANAGAKPFVLPAAPALVYATSMFLRCTAFNQTVTLPGTSSMTNVVSMFKGATLFNNGDVGDLSGKPLAFVTTTALQNTSQMFEGCSAFNQTLSLSITAGVTDMSSMFKTASVFNKLIAFDTSGVTTMNSMFSGAAAFNNGEIGTTGAAPLTLTTGNVRSLDDMFKQATSFNQTIVFSDTSKATMSEMFFAASAFNNGGGVNPLTWDTSAATSFSAMFYNTAAFNQQVAFTNTSNVQYMSAMFALARQFNNGVLGNVSGVPLAFSTSKLVDTGYMFQQCVSFNQELLFSNTTTLQTATSMFSGCTLFNNGDVTNAGLKQIVWATPALQTIDYMFTNCGAFNQTINFSDTTKITAVDLMFQNATVFNNGDITNSGLKPLVWTTTSLLSASSLFNNSTAFNQTVTFSDVSRVASLAYMFDGATLFNNGATSDVGGRQLSFATTTSALTNANSMFNNCAAFNQTVTFGSTAGVTTFYQMFANASIFNNGDVGDLSGHPMTFTTTTALLNLSQMFASCSVFNQSVSFSTTAGVTAMSYMFQYASVFNKAVAFDDTSSVTTMNSMFYGATAFNNGEVGNTGAAPLAFNTGNVASLDSMFRDANSFNQHLVLSDASKATMGFMFSGAAAFNNGNGVNPVTWNASSATSLVGMFFGASSFNQTVALTNTSNVTTIVEMFTLCSSFDNGGVPFVLNTASLVDATDVFDSCTSFNQEIQFTDTSALQTTTTMFYGCTLFNNGDATDASSKPLVWTTPALQATDDMFTNCLSFNQALTFSDVSNVTTMSNMLQNCTAFKQDLSAWRPTLCADFGGFYNGDMNQPDSATSQANYDALLNAWAALPFLQPGVTFDMGTTKYSASAAGIARGTIVGYGWTINDGGALP